MSGENRSAREKVSEGIRQGIGVLSAFKDALEETIVEARERGDLSPERAKKAMSDALQKAQVAAEEARERLDFAHQEEFESLRAEVDRLRERVEALEGRSRGESSRGWHGTEADAGGAPPSDAGSTGPEAPA